MLTETLRGMRLNGLPSDAACEFDDLFWGSKLMAMFLLGAALMGSVTVALMSKTKTQKKVADILDSDNSEDEAVNMKSVLIFFRFWPIKKLLQSFFISFSVLITALPFYNV